MPKRPQHAEVAQLANRFRLRMITEQQRRGWSDAQMAKAISENGVPMAPATVWKIKNANPPRKVDLDEAQAIAAAFGVPSLAAFMVEPEVVVEGLFKDAAMAAADMYRVGRRLAADILYADKVETDMRTDGSQRARASAAVTIRTNAVSIGVLVDAIAHIAEGGGREDERSIVIAAVQDLIDHPIGGADEYYIHSARTSVLREKR